MMLREVQNETSPPTISAFRRGRCRAAEATSWLGIGAPKNTPVEIVDKLNKEINAASPIPA
jgi:Tripartite tricarboxylate transporter family receptor